MNNEFSTPNWRKSSHSGGEGGQCVELADLGAAIGLRDSKNPAAGHLSLAPANLASLLTWIKADVLSS